MNRPTRERWQEIMQWMRTGLPYGNTPGWDEIVAEVDSLEDDYDHDIDYCRRERNCLQDRVKKLRNALNNIKQTQCPHFKIMKQTCTCVYDEASIALNEDDKKYEI